MPADAPVSPIAEPQMTDANAGALPAAEAATTACEDQSNAPPTPTAATAPAEPAARESVEPFRFTGAAGEYFRIWIVNTFLTIVTIGLWSPWAKIRKRRFFLRHTWVAGANFEYHAQPWPILRGRLLAGAAFIAYWFTGEINPAYAPWIGLVLAVLAPWLVVSSLRFNLGNTSYRNLRFTFDGRMLDGARTFWPLAVIAALTLLFPPVFDPTNFDKFDWKMLLPSVALLSLYPYLHGAFRLLVLNHARFGDAPVRCSTRIRSFYAIYLRSMLVALGLLIVLGVIAFVLIMAAMAAGIQQLLANSKWLAMATAWLSVLPLAIGGLVWFAFTQTRVINATFNQTTVSGNVRVRSFIKTWPMARLYTVNTIAVLLTAGLAIPWAAVRTARQRVETTALVIDGEIDDIIAGVVPTSSAAADAATDFFSFDLGL